MSETIKVLKLKSTEEVVGRYELVTGFKDQAHKLTKARQIVMQPMGQGQIGIAMLPWLASNQDGEVVIRDNHLACEPMDAPEQLEKEYLQQTTGIALAK